MKKSSRARSLCIGMMASLLWWGVVFHPPFSEAVESALNIVPSPSGLTVEAHGVGVEEVLREMGEKMGFTVVAKEAVHPVVDVSIKDATPEEALQQVLRGENYAIVYGRSEGEQTQAEKIDKILLLSPPNAVTKDLNGQPSKNGQAQLRASLAEQGGIPAETSLPEQATAAVFGKNGWTVIQRGERPAPTVANRRGGEERSSAAVANASETQASQSLAEQDQTEGNQ